MLCILQARMSSKRLPGKTLKKVGDKDEPDFQGRQIPNSMRQADGDVKVYYSRPREGQSND